MDNWAQLRRASDAHKQKSNDFKDSRQQATHQKVQQSIEKRLRTTFIGAISRFEEIFGRIWGHGSDKPLTEAQQAAKQLWEKCRASILDFGNDQIRYFRKDFSQFDIEVKRNKYIFPVAGRDLNKGD